MSKYNFEDDEDKYGKTQRLDSINNELKKYKSYEDSNSSDKYSYENQEIERKLGNKDSYLNSINSENLPKKSVSYEKFSDKTMVSNDFKNIDSLKSEDFGDTVILKGDLFENNNKPKAKKKKKGQYGLFIGITLLVGIIVFVAVFTYAFNYVRNGKGDLVGGENNIVSVPKTSSPNFVDSVDSNRIVLRDIDKNKNFSIKPDSKTKIFDKNGKESSLKSISVGDIINIELDNNDNVLEIKYPSEYFEVGNKESAVSGFTFSDDFKYISYNDKRYNINDNIEVVYKNRNIAVSDLTDIDSIMFKGYKNTVYYIEVFNLHGSINIKNSDKIENGSITIDNEKTYNFSEKTNIPVSEGSHNIIISGDNIDDYSTNVYIVSGEGFDIDLNDFKGNKSVLIIKANVSDYKLYIDDKLVEKSFEPQVLDSGEYNIRIEKDGYETWEKTVTLDKKTMEVTAELSKIPEEKFTFVITTYPPDASIYIDDSYVGKSPMSMSLEKGDYKFTAKLSGHKDINRDITIDSSTKSIDYSFQ